MDCGPPGSSVHGILQARILEWVGMPFSRGSSRPRDQTQVFWLAGRFFTTKHWGSPKLRMEESKFGVLEFKGQRVREYIRMIPTDQVCV